MDRLTALNVLVAQLRARSYLEVGVQTGVVFRGVTVRDKVGVDPDPTSAATVKMTSDDYFASLADLDPARRFDLIFIDGLHLAEQVARDASHALRVLTPGGCIVFHDCDPPTERSQRREMDPALWCGDTWRAWVALRERMYGLPGVDTYTVDADLGLGVVVTSRLFGVPPMAPVAPAVNSYESFSRQRRELLGLISPAGFRQRVAGMDPLR